MGLVIGVAWYAVQAAGGMDTMLARLAEARTAAGPGASDITAFFPDFSRGLTAEALWTLPVLTFLVHLSVQWWAFWYPGAEPGGGGYIAQRIFSTKDERNGLLSVLWFNIAHYALRPWPWILTALAAAVLYPNLEHPETGYMLMATEHFPPALRGILLAGFLAAFMSTIATQLNWGTSYLVEDFYRRFIRPKGTESHYVKVSRALTLVLVAVIGVVAAQLASIREGWTFVLEVGAGTGAVYILRWYWWRINAWSEISAMATALVVSVTIHFAKPFSDTGAVLFAKSALTTTGMTTIVWLIVTFLTPPESSAVLTSFYRKVRPHAAGWKRIAALAPDVPPTRDLKTNLGNWLLGCVMIYSALIGVGKLLLGVYAIGVGLLVLAVVSGWMLYEQISELQTTG